MVAHGPGTYLRDGPVAPRPSGDEVRAHRLAQVLPALLTSAARIPSLAVKYEPWLDPTRTPALHELPVLTRAELVRAAEEITKLPEGAGPALRWAEGGTLAEPGLTLAPEHMFAPQIRWTWQPLGPRDVLLNLHPPGTLRPDHYLFNRFAAESGASTFAFGRPPAGAWDDWQEFFGRQGVTAVAAPPETLERLIGSTSSGRPLPWLRTLLLGGTTHDTTSDTRIAECFPYTEVWRLYGAPGAWVVGQRGPQCRPDVYHPLPHQYVEIVDGNLLVTTLETGKTPPLIRYETRDRAEFTACTCSLRTPAIRVLGPTAPYFRFHGRTFSAREVAELAISTEEVAAAQVAVNGEQRIQLRVRLVPGVPDDHHTHEWIRFQVLRGHLALAAGLADQPELFDVVVVDELNSTSDLVSDEF
jgi:phenylacetate-CoA ligase